MMMGTSTAFESLCGELEEETSLDRLEARGTVRIALHRAGLDAESLTPDQVTVVLERVLPAELVQRGIDDADGVCRRAADRSRNVPVAAAGPDTPEAIFRRLGG